MAPGILTHIPIDSLPIQLYLVDAFKYAASAVAAAAVLSALYLTS
jgi:hypothetical protein